MEPQNQVLSFMDILDLDEEIVDIQLKTIMERSTFTNKHLRCAVHLLQYKNLINVKDDMECDNEEECTFIAKLISSANSENIENVCKIISVVLDLNKSSLISKSEHLIQQILENINLSTTNARGDSNEYNDTEIASKILIKFKLCDSILGTIMRNNLKLNLPLLETPLEEILSNSDETLKKYFLNNIVPKLFHGIIGYNIIDRIWQYLKEFQHEKKEDALKVLSCLSEFYLPVADEKGNVKYQSEIVLHYEFWNILLFALNSNNTTSRKFAVYLIKRAIDSLETVKKDFSIITEESKIFNWQHREMKIIKENWNTFFVLFDSLEEKQSNIVLPSLQIFDTIKGIESCWVNCAFNIGLKHDNAQVRLKCIEHRLKTKLSNLSDAVVLIEALNDVNYYDDPEDCESIKYKISGLLTDVESFIYILKSIPNVKWSPVPLFHISDVLSEQHNVDINMSPEQFTNMAIDILKVPCNDKVMRNAVKLNITYFVGQYGNGLNWRHLMNIYSFLNWDRANYCTIEEDNPFLVHIKDITFNIGEKEDFFKIAAVHTNIDFLLLYLEHHPNDVNNLIEIIDQKFENIKDIINRQYSDKLVCLADMVFITNLFSKNKMKYSFHSYLAARLSKEYKLVTQYLLCLLTEEKFLKIEDLHLIFEGYGAMIDATDIDDFEIIWQLYQRATVFIKFANNALVSKVFPIFVIRSLTDRLKHKNKLLSLTELLTLIKNGKFLATAAAVDNGRYSNLFYEKSCEIVYKYFMFDTVDDKKEVDRNTKGVIELIEKVVECGGYGCLKWILRLINEILPKILEDDTIEFDIIQFISRMWKEIEELKSNNQYTPCIKEFATLITQDSLLNKPMYNNTVILYCSQIIEYGALKTSPLYYLNEELRKKSINENLGHIICVLCDVLLFSPVPRKDQRILDNVAIQILQDSNDVLQSSVVEDRFIYAVQYSSIVTLSRIEYAEVFETIVSIFINKIEDHFKNKLRYHGNSQSHRSLLIALQHLLVIPLLNLKILETVYYASWAMDLLGRMPHQPSVRICLEWFISLHLYVKGIILNENTVEIMKLKTIPLISQFMILYWTIKHKISNKTYKIEEFDFVMDTLLSHAMGQIFNVRLHAQYLATELYKVKMSSKYAYIIEVIQKTFAESANDKSFIKMEEDFFVKHFDIVEHLKPSFIYYYLPRYCSIGSNENVDRNYLFSCTSQVTEACKTRDIASDFKREWIKLDTFYGNNHSKLFNYYLNQNNKQTSRSADIADTAGTIQKKYVPWKNMSDIDVYESGKRKESQSELIVVASLIDKLPNLGGMARTSEVFGVKTYVVDSLRHLQDKQFLGLSVSAERWVNIEEVRPGQPLKDYLMRKKTEGYSVVAAEQTSTSCQLQRFKFPKKTLLLLGHEKEGVPCDLLPMMDHCVEIPQQGFVRSLNVHVTAAIFVWEYSRQNIL